MTMLSFERAAAAANPVRSAIRLGGLHLQLPAAAAALIASPPLRFGARGRSPEQLAHYRKEKNMNLTPRALFRTTRKKTQKGAARCHGGGRSTEAAGAPARTMWPPWRWRREQGDNFLKTDEEKAATAEHLASSIDSRRSRRRRKTSSSSTAAAALASALRAGLGVFLFAAVGLWSWDPLKVLILERELRKTTGGTRGGDSSASEEELRAQARVALAAKANLNAAVTVALLSAPASLGNTVGIAVQRMAGAALGCLAAAGVAALGHGAAAAVLLRGAGGGAQGGTGGGAVSSRASNAASALVQATLAVALGTLAVYLGQRARIQYGAQLFGVSLLFVLAQAGSDPGAALLLALSRGGGVVAGAALAAVLAVAVMPQSAARGAGRAAEGSLFAVADLAGAALGGRGGGGGEDGEEDENDGDGSDAAAPPPPPFSTATAAAAKRVLSFLSELDDCLAWAPAEVAVRFPAVRCFGGGSGGRGGGGGGTGRLLFFLPSPRAALCLPPSGPSCCSAAASSSPSSSCSSSPRPPVPVEEITALSLSLRAASSTLTTVGAVRARRLPRSVREALRPPPTAAASSSDVAGDKLTSSPVPSPSSGSSSPPDAFELISPVAVAAWEALGDAWRDRERLRQRRGRRGASAGGGREDDDCSSSVSFSGERADAAVAALSASAASAGERARARAAAARALALRETEEALSASTTATTASTATTTYRGMFERVLLASSSPSSSAPSPSLSQSPSRLAARARARFLAEVALVSKVARDAERALECLRAAVEAL